MSKRLPADALIMLHNRLSTLSSRDVKRKPIIAETAEFYGVSIASVYRALRKHNKPGISLRADYNKPRLIEQRQMKLYCELIAALKLRTTNKKGRHLSTNECIRILETYGIETTDGLVKVASGLLKKSTISFYLKRFGLDYPSLFIQPPVVHFQAKHSNECWQFDFSPSDFKDFYDSSDSGREKMPKVMLASVVDDRSGVAYQEYHYTYGEDVMTALKFLFNAMSAKKQLNCLMQGIPKAIYTDNGPVSKSIVFKRVMAYLGVEVINHMPEGKAGRRKTARSKGKVERAFRTVKESLESLYHLHPPRDLAQANEWLRNYLDRYNQKKHRYESHSRMEDWKYNLPKEGFRAMCDWERFSAMAREPEIRKVGSDACVNVNGVKYQLSGEFAGLSVTLLMGLFDNELRIEHGGKNHGPFYPANEPIPFGKYRAFKKTSQERRSDEIESLAKIISLPRSVLDDKNSSTEEILNNACLIEESIPCQPFVTENRFTHEKFNDMTEAKIAVAHWLGYPLGRLLPQQIEAIDKIINDSLDKKLVMAQVKQLFAIKLVVT